MKSALVLLISSCLFVAVYSQFSMPPRCIEQEECDPGTCCLGVPPFGGVCQPLTPEGGECQVVEKTVPLFGDFNIGSCPCAEGLVCVQQGTKKNNGVCQVPPTTAAPPAEPDVTDAAAEE